MVVILMGVSGSGKTTVGRRLARTLEWPYFEGDEFHPRPNIEKMSGGEPLNDADRAPWLESLQTLISKLSKDDRSAVLSCSALKKSYRKVLLDGNEAATIVYLKGDKQLFRERLENRGGHFMEAEMLDSQFNAFEPPDEEEDVFIVDASRSPDAIAETIIEELALQQV